MITHSFVMAVLESYSMAQKQIWLLSKLLPKNWEIIFVDDGSDPPIPVSEQEMMMHENFILVRSGEVRREGEWTQHLAINKAVEMARGRYIVKNDVDHVFTPGAVEAVEEFIGDMMLFRREAGRLNEDLTVTSLRDVHPVYSPIDDVYAVKKSIFQGLGGYPVEATRKYGGMGRFLWGYSEKKEARSIPEKALIYVVPDTEERYHSLVRVR